ncbi:hypothetical protein HNQ71_007083 [Mesorhizobium sangaii]|uniref:IstB-like ATP-binding domain-containing protein n=1 Tax=Mesorhizobium sangaii TaxID=505389 RepID=A0A841PL86_9HYPH|nr:hypothetical protein [Mesorhizobium sangaii]
MPAQIAEIAFQNKAAVYTILFKAASEALRVAAADPKHLGAAIGVVAVLHTLLDRLLHHAVVVQIEGPSYRLRQHAELMPEHVRSKALITPPSFAPPSRQRGRPPKNTQYSMPSETA